MRRFLITGATSGLGKAVEHALQFTADEVEIVSMGRSSACSLPLDFDHHVCSMLTISGAVKSAGPFDGIVHAAGSEVVAPLRLTSDEQYRQAMMCADSAFAILRAAASKGVMADGGSIVMISSVAAHRGTPGMVAYSMGKAAVEGAIKSAALELKSRRIRVNCVAPGAFRSPMHERIVKRMPAGEDAYAAKHPLGIGSVEAVRDAVLFLLSADWITGQTMVVDGGYLA